MSNNYDERMNDHADEHAKLMSEQRNPSKPLPIKERRLRMHTTSVRIKAANDKKQ